MLSGRFVDHNFKTATAPSFPAQIWGYNKLSPTWPEVITTTVDNLELSVIAKFSLLVCGKINIYAICPVTHRSKNKLVFTYHDPHVKEAVSIGRSALAHSNNLGLAIDHGLTVLYIRNLFADLEIDLRK